MYLYRDFAVCVYQSLLTGDTVSNVDILDLDKHLPQSPFTGQFFR
jgi:hypothetical protein